MGRKLSVSVSCIVWDHSMGRDLIARNSIMTGETCSLEESTSIEVVLSILKPISKTKYHSHTKMAPARPPALSTPQDTASETSRAPPPAAPTGGAGASVGARAGAEAL